VFKVDDELLIAQQNYYATIESTVRDIGPRFQITLYLLVNLPDRSALKLEIKRFIIASHLTATSLLIH
jgi:hypothetical protein